MFNKVYEKIEKFMKENIRYILILIVSYLVLTFPLPYYIYSGGGTMNINDKINIEAATNSKGSFHFAYVKELRGNVASFLLAKLIPSWDIEKEEELKLNEDETKDDIEFRNHLYLNTANQTAILLAYDRAGATANISKTHFYILYVEDHQSTNMQVGDEIISIENQQMKDIKTYQEVIAKKQVGQDVEIIVKRDGKLKTLKAKVKEIDGKKVTGISIATIYEYDTTPKLSLNFKASEGGPSGGLMLTLAIYNKLTKQDITHGKKIVGTGTIEPDGTVGQIGGVKYKLKGAVDANADIFLVPAGDNYEDAIKEKKKHHYDIIIQKVATLDEALEFLNSLK